MFLFSCVYILCKIVFFCILEFKCFYTGSEWSANCLKNNQTIKYVSVKSVKFIFLSVSNQMSILLIDLKCNSPQAHFGGQEELGAVASHSFWWTEAISEQELKAVQSSQSSLNSLQASSVPLVYYWGLHTFSSQSRLSSYSGITELIRVYKQKKKRLLTSGICL